MCNKKFMTYAMKNETNVIIVISIVKLISKIHDKITIVKTIIYRSTTLSFYIFIIRFSIIIQVKILFTIIKNINIVITIDNQTTSKINNSFLLLILFRNCRSFVNYCNWSTKTRQIRKIKTLIDRLQS